VITYGLADNDEEPSVALCWAISAMTALLYVAQISFTSRSLFEGCITLTTYFNGFFDSFSHFR